MSGEEPPAASPAYALARPKSRTLTLPSGVILTLAGLRSRWTMPFSWASSSASAICFATSRASSIAIGPRLRRTARSSPSTSSSTRNGLLSASSKPWMAAMLGWLREARTWASRLKRASRSGSPATLAGRTLIATSRLSFVSRARYTSPIPPAPSGARISYGPRCTPGVGPLPCSLNVVGRPL